MSKIRIVVKHGASVDLKQGVLVEGELGYNIDTKELFAGDADGNPIKVAEVVQGPDDGLYLDTPNGYLPLCIKRGG